MLYTETYTPTYDVVSDDTYSSEYTDYYFASTLAKLQPHHLGVNVSLDTLEVTYVEFSRKPHPVHDKHPGKGRR